MKRFLAIAGALIGLTTAAVAQAALLPNTPCDPQQFGCGGASANVIYQFFAGAGVVGGFTFLLVQIAAGLAVLFIVWSGFRMVTSLGDEGKVSQFKWGVANALLGLIVVILAEFVISVVGSQYYGQAGVGGNLYLPQNLLVVAVGVLRIILNAAFVIVAGIAGLRMLYSQGKTEDYTKGKTMITWAIVGAIIVNLAAALANAVSSYFGV